MVKKIVIVFFLRWHDTYKSDFTFTGSSENLEDFLARIETSFIQANHHTSPAPGHRF